MRLYRIIAAAMLVTLSGASTVLVLDGLNDDIQVSDVGVVLGSKVMPDGEPSERLQARLDRAAELWRQQKFEYFIVSGGTGAEGHSEALAMADYLEVYQQVSRDRIILDEKGVTTEATARNVAAIMGARGMKSALVVTQYFHIPRSRYALRRAGIQRVSTAHARFFEARDLYSIARELVALPVYWLAR